MLALSLIASLALVPSTMPQPKKKFTFITRKAPYGTSYGNVCLDAVLTTSAFEQDIVLVFMDDGVYQLKKNQDPDCISAKNLSKGFGALSLYDIENIYVEQESLAARGLRIHDLVIEVKAISAPQLGSIIENSDVVLNF